MNIYVGSLSFKTTEEQLRQEFEAFGEVDSVKIILDQETLRSRGFGFVIMPDREQAMAAIAGMNGKEVNGFNLKVNEAKPREPRGPGRERTGNTYGGGGGDRPRTGGYPSGGQGAGAGGGGRDRHSTFDNRGNNIYDNKGGRSGDFDRKGRGGGRSGGGRRSY